MRRLVSFVDRRFGRMLVVALGGLAAWILSLAGLIRIHAWISEGFGIVSAETGVHPVLELGAMALLAALTALLAVFAARHYAADRREKRQRALLERLAAELPAVVWASTPDGREILHVNPAFAEVYGRPVESLKERPELWHEVIHPEDKEQVLKESEQLMDPARGTEAVRLRYRILRPDGTVRWIHDHKMVIFGADRRPLFLAGIAEDITELERSREQALRLQRRLAQDEKFHALGRLTGGIAHDFNNVLGTLMGYIGLIEMRYGSDCPPQVRDYLARMRQAGDRADQMVQQLLRYSRGSSAQLKPVQLAELAAEVCGLLSASLDGRIQLCFSADAVPPVWGDEVQLHQLLMNLCLNGIEAMPEGGRLDVRLRQLTRDGGECSLCRRSLVGSWVALSVADQGPGLDASLQARIFEPFFTTRSDRQGVGMGLAMVNRIVDGHDAHLLLESEPGIGTCFRILFPPLENDMLDPVPG